MSYTVLARRYRSRDFDELVGQEPIARTLRNAIESDRTAHAYLFTGTRGVGKTSMARIFAKALNVSDDLAEADQIAEAILRGDDLDVVEIDGASNRGIGEARDLIANSGLSPARCRYKIYIIDEVHQITKDAFNALLKTMEEPPAHVKFILCTTEPQKVPATIQSRCQRFDFRPLSSARIAEQLRHILTSEGLEADDDVVAQIARLGRGSMRDALSLLDRLLAAGEPKLTSALLEQMLGLPDHAMIERVVQSIADADPADALERGDELLASGCSIDQALETLIEHLRDLLIVSSCGPESTLVELPDEARQEAQRVAAQFETSSLLYMIALCESAARNARGASTARSLFDAAIVRLALREQLTDAAALLERDGEKTTAGTTPGKKKAPPVDASTRSQRPEESAQATVEPKIPDSKDPVDGAALWAEVIGAASDSPTMQAKVENLAFEQFDGHTLHLGVRTADAGLARWLATQSSALARLVEQTTGRRVSVSVTAPAEQTTPPGESQADKVRQAEKLPAVQTVMEVFDATVVAVDEASDSGDLNLGATPNDV